MSASPSSLGMVVEAIKGHLYKKNAQGVWIRRFCVVVGQFLHLYKNSKCQRGVALITLDLVGKISVSGCITDELGTGTIFEIDMKDGKFFVLRAVSFDDARRWVDVLEYQRNYYIQNPHLLMPLPDMKESEKASETASVCNSTQAMMSFNDSASVRSAESSIAHPCPKEMLIDPAVSIVPPNEPVVALVLKNESPSATQNKQLGEPLHETMSSLHTI